MLVYSARMASSRERELLEPEDWITATRGSAHVTPRWKFAEGTTLDAIAAAAAASSAMDSDLVRLFWRLDFSAESCRESEVAVASPDVSRSSDLSVLRSLSCLS